MTDPLLDVREATICYGAAVAVSGVSLNVRENEVVAILGANGAGKSTLLKAISGLIPLSGGIIRYRREGPRESAGLPAGPGRHSSCSRRAPDIHHPFHPRKPCDGRVQPASHGGGRANEGSLCAVSHPFGALGPDGRKPFGR